MVFSMEYLRKQHSFLLIIFIFDFLTPIKSCWTPPLWIGSNNVLQLSLPDHFQDWHYLHSDLSQLSSIYLYMGWLETLLHSVLSWEVIHVLFLQITMISLTPCMQINALFLAIPKVMHLYRASLVSNFIISIIFFSINAFLLNNCFSNVN